MTELGVNIDHVATLRQARRTYEPDPVHAAVEAQLAGASCITVHLREDRRHIQDHDLQRIAQVCHVKLNLEMAATAAMVKIACQTKPQMATLVPEGRMEVTTEGGLDVLGHRRELRQAVRKLHDAGILVSAFIDAETAQIDASKEAGFDACEIHTGPYAKAFHEAAGNFHVSALAAELQAVREAGQRIQGLGMRFNAGHALNYLNVQPIAALPGAWELHIGHAIISRSVFVGLQTAIREMRQLMRDAVSVR